MSAVTYRFQGYTVIEHRIQVPLDYFGAFTELPPNEEIAHVPATITIFAREIVRAGREDAPRLVYLEGGPGHAAPRPAGLSGWQDLLLNHYRLVLLDERGTGNSYPLDSLTITAAGSPAAQAALLSCFRQDSIVNDAEHLRRHLQGEEPWSVLGQSFGGFAAVSYLSHAPAGLREVMITGGLPSLDEGPQAVYRQTFPRLAARNRAYFERYPDDEGTAWYITTHLADVEEILPTGERLTPARFRQLGQRLGFTYGFEQLHYLLEDPVWSFRGQRRLRPSFLQRVGEAVSAAHAPLYFALQEAIYAQLGTGPLAWAAHRIRGEFPEFAIPALAMGGVGETDLRKEGRGFRFSGESVFPWQFEQDPALLPLRGAANELAFRTSWHDLYRPDVLGGNQVPVAAWIFRQDMYVPAELSLETAGRIRGLTALISDDYQHDALGRDPHTVISALLDAVYREP
ncbi:alpha/beta fold hydrolase [Actinotignum sanguinis]|uniref:alpha/beta fold hydrolase n=1 Tax=Actinotignum sanguinis TaxID=1445614 RepID=UPI0029351DC5|nr:alpha/beta fold hydrolase [Actinotignum sanguinis]MDV2436476.1 alpha/beta fold hydrolase [Actinotignum sanguinis]